MPLPPICDSLTTPNGDDDGGMIGVRFENVRKLSQPSPDDDSLGANVEFEERYSRSTKFKFRLADDVSFGASIFLNNVDNIGVACGSFGRDDNSGDVEMIECVWDATDDDVIVVCIDDGVVTAVDVKDVVVTVIDDDDSVVGADDVMVLSIEVEKFTIESVV